MRSMLWDYIRGTNPNNEPWLLMGDFNQILSCKDKISKCSASRGTKDFMDGITSCGLVEIVSQGSGYTWTNNRSDASCVWECLDRGLYNLEWLDLFHNQH